MPITAVCAALTTFACGSRTALFGELGGSVTVGDAGGNPTDAASPLDSAVRGSTCSIFRSRVFLTSTMHDGNFGGVRGADAECAAEARAQRLGSAWRAWLSDSSAPAFEHIYAAPGGYALLDGTVVAPTFNALVSGSLAHAIDLRNPYVDALSAVQVELLGRLRRPGIDAAEAAALRSVVGATINGVAAGLQNTG